MVTARKKGVPLQGDALVSSAHLQEQIEEAGLSPSDQATLLMGLALGEWIRRGAAPRRAGRSPVARREACAVTPVARPRQHVALVLLARVSAHRAGVDWEASEDAGADPALLRVIWSGKYAERTGSRAQGAMMQVRLP